MEKLFDSSKYVFNPISHIWSRPGYGGISYNDGDEIEQRIASIIEDADDISVLSPELRQHCNDWPSLYHLSGMRANILRPFAESISSGDILEVGAGCGAITRFLGECGANVLALEGSPRRAAIARSRTMGLENVTVLAERFSSFQTDKKFDVITLIGVLEYANMFTSAENPALAMLQQILTLLKPNGKLIIAIENQLGLKYFAGAPEDHIGKVMYGVEGRYRNDQPQTYGKEFLTELLQQAGFLSSNFLAPYPDYKLPVSIVTEEGMNTPAFDSSAFAWQSARRDPQLPSYTNFSMELVWPEIFKNGIAMDVANSFLVIASPEEQDFLNDKNETLAFHYSTDRIPKYCKETKFKKIDNNNIEIAYTRLSKIEERGDDDVEHVIDFDCPIKDVYRAGKPMSWKFIQIVTEEGWKIDEVGAFLKHYILVLKYFLKQKDVELSLDSLESKLPGKYFDITPQNIIIENETPMMIDAEWVLAEEVELGHLLFRSLLWMLGSITRFGQNIDNITYTHIEFVRSAFKAISFDLTDEKLTSFLEVESRVQKQITGSDPVDFLQSWQHQRIRKHDLSQFLHNNINEKETHIQNINQSIVEKNTHIDNLVQNDTLKNAHITNLEQDILAKDNHITNLEQDILAKDNHIANMVQNIADINDQLLSSNHSNAEKDDLINALVGSKSWTLTKPLRNSFLIMRRFKKLIYLTSFILKEHGFRKSLRKSKEIIKAYGFSGIRDRVVDEYVKVKSHDSFAWNNDLNVEFDKLELMLDSGGNYSLVKEKAPYVYIEPDKPMGFLELVDSLETKTKFSIVVPVYNTEAWMLQSAIDSVQRQWYGQWEMILVNDASTREETIALLAELDIDRIKVLNLTENVGIASATNAGINESKGEFIVFMDHDDELTPDCLYELAKKIDEDNPDYVYSDEDKISDKMEYIDPHFKPDWSPETLMSIMYTSHVSCIRKSLVKQVGGLNPQLDGCQDWDLVLRVTEQTSRISHIAKVLYHWRVLEGSVALSLKAKPYVESATIKLKNEALLRRNLKGSLEKVPGRDGYWKVNYYPQENPLISIIIPSKDNFKILRNCLNSIEKNTSYDNYEIVLVDNGSSDVETLEYLEKIREKTRVNIIKHDAPFNFSALCNIGAKKSNGEVLLFLNDDIEVISHDWLERLCGYAQLDHVGAVGAKLLYPGGKYIQHCGIINSYNGPGHAFLHKPRNYDGYFLRCDIEYNWSAVTGACLMLETTKFQEIGGFDEALPIAYNDVDLCFSLLNHGYFNVLCPSVELIHHESVSRGKDDIDPVKMKRLDTEKKKLYNKHPKFYSYDPFHNINLKAIANYFE